MENGLLQFDFPFEFEVVGTVTGKKFCGGFTYSRPNIRVISNIGKYKALLNGEYGRNLEPHILGLHNMLSELRYVLTDFPKWWEECDFGLKLHDFNVVSELYSKVAEFEQKFATDVPEIVLKKVENKKNEKNEKSES